ncbi:MAG TPA: hypothetical protein VNL39_02225 [Xanthobacteraceae bacterium]|jgi:hypothetical protein|nr:hypothetical protein [Xanthobacteraceae bacterium]
MELNPIVLAVLGAALAWVVFVVAQRWWVNWSARRIVSGILHGRYADTQERMRSTPENLYVVELTADAIACRYPSGTTERVSWEDLRRVEILTTDGGPFATDLFWVLHGSRAGCVIPQGAAGEKDLLQRLQALPGFRSEVVIEAGASTVNRRFVCWEREPGI